MFQMGFAYNHKIANIGIILCVIWSLIEVKAREIQHNICEFGFYDVFVIFHFVAHFSDI